MTAHVTWATLVGIGFCMGALVQAGTNIAVIALLGLLVGAWLLICLVAAKLMAVGSHGECPNCGCAVPDDAEWCWHCEDPLR
jgi:hypothetical protein